MVLSLNPINNIYNINRVALKSAIEVWDLQQHSGHMSKTTIQQNTTTSDWNTGCQDRKKHNIQAEFWFHLSSVERKKCPTFSPSQQVFMREPSFQNMNIHL